MLKHESKVLTNLKATMSELDIYDDHVLALEAVKASESSRLIRQPFKPRDPQTFSPPAKQNQKRGNDSVPDLKTFLTNEIQGTLGVNVNNENSGDHPGPHQLNPSNHGYLSGQHPSHDTDLISPRQPKLSHRTVANLSNSARQSPAALGQSPPAWYVTSQNAPAADEHQSANLGQDFKRNGFSRYYDSLANGVRASKPAYTESKLLHRVSVLQLRCSDVAQVRQSLHRAYEDLLPAQRAQYEQDPESPFYPIGFKQEPQNETKDLVEESFDEPPITVDELKEQKTKAFQLQNLLKDAGPEVLESSVRVS